MHLSFIDKWVQAWRDKREARARQTVNYLTIKYQLFRGLLDRNNEAITLLSDLDVLSHSEALLLEQQTQVIQMIDAVEEMVDLLNQLDGSHQNLRVRFQTLRQLIEKRLPSSSVSESVPATLNLKDISPQQLAAVGNKAGSLAILTSEPGFNIPPGFVVTADACRDFLQHDQLYAKIQQLLRPYSPLDEIPDTTIQQIQNHIQEAEIPDFLEENIVESCQPFFNRGIGLAVRSSSRQEDTVSHSFAGQYDTVLNVTDQHQALSAFRQVVASNYNTRCMAYRQKAGLPRPEFDMAVLFLEMVDARSAGVTLTKDPSGNSRDMIISAVYGLGEAVVSGSMPTDIYYLDENGQLDKERSIIETKTKQVVNHPQGGAIHNAVPEESKHEPVLSPENLQLLFEWGQKLEKLRQGPQDIEWAFDLTGKPVLLQTRPLIIKDLKGDLRKDPHRPKLITGLGIHIRRQQELNQLPDVPVILLLRQSMPDAGQVMDRVSGLLIEYGNPTDHLALVAREYGVPILYGKIDRYLNDAHQKWLTMIPAEHTVRAATEDEIGQAKVLKQNNHLEKKVPKGYSPGSLGELLFPLHLTDAYGPMFSFAECKSLHDMIRYAHEKGVLAMFDAGDAAIEEGGISIHIVDIEVPFLVNIIDLGGGLIPGERLGRFVPPATIQSHPLKALLKGICTETLNWGPQGEANMGSLMSRWMMDKRSARPIGLPNYAMITRDYLNLNARMDFHFTMIDTVCGFIPESNYIHFRFNGGGTDIERRSRRAKCIRSILEHHGFFTDQRNDLVGATIYGGSSDVISEKVKVLGQLLGFTRLLDAAMDHDDMVEPVVEAFIQGDFQLSYLKNKLDSPHPLQEK